MTYFKEIPDLLYPSQFPDKNSSDDYIKVKNIFKRAKLREDIANAITSFNYYQIKDFERPDQIAEKFYDDSELDWVVLITNNIINLNSDWPLDNESFYNYCIDKYGSEEKLNEIYGYETVKISDEYDRSVVVPGLIVDPTYVNNFNTLEGSVEYNLENFPPLESEVTVDLNQFNDIVGRDGPITVVITDINIETSILSALGRSGDIDIQVINTLTPWPSGWGGFIVVNKRDTSTIIIEIEDFIGEVDITLTELLYEIVGEEVDGIIVPIFRFKQL
jgi:hypothetical protein